MVEAIVSYLLTTYMSPYFSNFSKDNLKLSFLQGEVALRQLFFNDKILDSVSLPLKLKFGNLESLKISIPSYMNFAQSGLKIKLKNVFLCFEMLEVEKWNEETVIKSYQSAKRSRIKTYEQNTDQFYSHLTQGSKDDTTDLFHQILANLSVEIENVYVRFEDANLKLDIGILIPRIEMQSMNRHWELMDKVIDIAVLFKSMTIAKVDAYINYGESFRPLNEQIDLESFRQFASLSKSKREAVEKELRKFIRRTFDDSQSRFTDLEHQSLNKYILRGKAFSIDTRVQITLNKKKLLADSPDNKDPDLKLDMIFGGVFKKRAHESAQSQRTTENNKPADSINSSSIRDEGIVEESLSILIDEQQLKAALHFTTFMACYSDFSEGVIQSRFCSKANQFLTPEVLLDYLDHYAAFREAKFNQAQGNLHKQLFDHYEHEMRTDIVLMLRDAVTEKFFMEKKILRSQQTRQKSTGFWQTTWGQADSKVQIESERKHDEEDQHQIEETYQRRVENVRSLLRQFQSKEEPVLDPKFKDEAEKIAQSTRSQFRFLMPKLEIELFAMNHESYVDKQQEVPDFSCQGEQVSIASLSFTGLQVDFSHQTFPTNHLLQIELKSLHLRDPQIQTQVVSLNKKLPPGKQISDSVIETRFNEELQDQPFKREGKSQDDTDQKLLSLRVTITEENDFRPSSSADNPPSDDQGKRETRYDVDLTVLGKTVIFCNFAFIKRLLYLAGRVSADIRQKRLFLIKSIDTNGEKSPEQTKIKEHIINGFAFVSRLRDNLERQMADLKRKRLHLDQGNQLRLQILAYSPKLIIDEYLFGETVMERKRPVYFMLDMGKLMIKNNVYKQKLEAISGEPAKAEGFYESFDMRFVDLKIFAPDSEEGHESFEVFEKFDFGIQFQTLIERDLQLPDTIVNLKLKEVRLNFDRQILNQLFKVKSFFLHGSYNQAKEFLSGQMGRTEQELRRLQGEPVDPKVSSVMSMEFDVKVQPEPKPSTMRVNILFQGMKLTKYLIDRPTISSEELKSEQKPSKLVLKPQFQLAAEHLKIACLLRDKINDTERLEVFVFLQSLSVTDLEHPSYVYRNLIEQSIVKANPLINVLKGLSLVNPPEKNAMARISAAVAKHTSAALIPVRSSPISKEGDASNDSNASFISKQITPLKAFSMLYDQNSLINMFRNRFSTLTNAELLNFDDCAGFSPKQEYLEEEHQVAIRFISESETVDNLRHDLSETTIKIKKITVIALFKLIENLIQSQYNYLSDLQQSDVRYKSHLDKQNQRQTSQQSAVHQKEEDDDESPLLKQAVLHKGELKRVESTSMVKIVMPELKVSLPTNLLDKKCMTLKINTGFSFERSVRSVSEECPMVDDNGHPVSIHCDLLEQDNNTKVALTQLQMYLKYQPESKTTKLQSKSFAQKTFKCDESFQQRMQGGMIGLLRLAEIEKTPSMTKSQIIFPFDFVFQSESQCFTKTKVERDLHVQGQEHMSLKRLVTLIKSNAGMVEKAKSDIRILTGFKLQLRLVEVAKYQQIIQQLLFFQNKVINLKPEESDVHLLQLNEQPSSPTRRSNTLGKISKMRQHLSHNKLQQEGQVYAADLTRAKTLQHGRKSTEVTAVEQVPVQSVPETFAELIEMSTEKRSDLTEKLSDDVKDRISIEELVAQHTRQEQAVSIAARLRQNFVEQKPKDIRFAQTRVSTLGSFKICLLDDLTMSYEESLLSLVLTTFVFDTQGITTSNQSPFVAEQQFGSERDRLSHYFGIPNDLPYSQQIVKLGLEVQNFNHKSLNQEYLLEPWNFTFQTLQKSPLAQRVMKLKSLEFLNINLTYGCLLSLNKALSEIREEVKVKIQRKKTVNKVPSLGLITEEKEASEADMELEESMEKSNEHEKSLHRAQSQERLKDARWMGPSKSLLEFDTKKFAEAIKDGKVNFSNIEDQFKQQVMNSEEYRRMMAKLDEIDRQRRQMLIPKFSFLNDFGKDLRFIISNELNDEGPEYWHPISAGEYIDGDETADDINRLIYALLSSYRTDELKRAQLYLSIQVEGYEPIRDFPLFQLGLFTLKLRPLKENRKTMQSQYLVVQLVRNKRDMKLSFESNALVFNNTKERIQFVAFDPALFTAQTGTFKTPADTQGPMDMTVDFYECEPQQVICLPFLWFEKGYQVQASFGALQIDNSTKNQGRKVQAFTMVRKMWLFQGNIRKVLNPRITDPYESHARVMETDRGLWLGLEFALLDTRTQFGQFVITFDYLCTFQNLMLTKLQLKPLSQPRRQLLPNLDSTVQAIVPDSEKIENVYSFETSQILPIPELNLDSGAWELELESETEQQQKYRAIVSHSARFQKASKLLQFNSGMIIELKSVSQDCQPTIKIVLEQLPGQGCLKNTDYNNFSLRRKIFHHKVCKSFQFFTPLIAVNLTRQPITLFHRAGKTHLQQTIKPHSSLFLDLSIDSHAKVNIQIPDYSISNKISLEAGQNFLTMERLLAKGLSKMELACSLSNLEQPYNKTRVLRIVQRYVLINRLHVPIVINQIGQTEEVCLYEQQSIDLSFYSDNPQSLVRLRLISRHDTLNQAQLEANQEVGYFNVNHDRNSHTKDHWSYQFSTRDIDDFQIVLPKFEDFSPERKHDKLSWTDQRDCLFARVTISNDQIDPGKLFIILSTPRSPDYLMLNYLDFPLVFREKEQAEHNRYFDIKPATMNILHSDGTISPNAQPFVLNPKLPVDCNILEFGEADRFKKTFSGSTTHFFNLDSDVERAFKIKRSDQRQVLIEMRLRESGNVKIIEVYPIAYKEKLKQDVRYQDRDEQKHDLRRQILTFDSLPGNTGQAQLQDDRMTIKLQGLGFSIVDFEPKELCYISFEGIAVDKSLSLFKQGTFQKTFTDFKMSVRNVQFDATDNQTFPILLGPVDPFRNIERQFRKAMNQEQETGLKPYLKLCLNSTQENDGDTETKAIQKLKFSLADTAIKVHLHFISQVQAMIFSFQGLLKEQDIFWQSEIYRNFGIIQGLLTGTCEEPDSLFSQVSDIKVQLESQAKEQHKDKPQTHHETNQLLNPFLQDQMANTQLLGYQKIFAEHIHIKAIKIVMSMRLRGIEGVLNQRGPLGFLLNLSSNFADISDAEFNFDELKLNKVHLSQEALQANLASHYKEIALQQFYQLFGSQDILGNPSSFIANLGRGAGDLKNAPFDMLLADDPSQAGLGVYIAAKGLLKNTTIAVSTSYSGISGSLFLGLKNICGAGMTHENLDQPLSITGGLQKGLVGFAEEVGSGIAGPYVVPRNRIRKQGSGFPQLAKGFGMGLLQFTTFPLNAALRLTYDLSTGVKNQVQGLKYRGQRFRHPRYFDQNQRMLPYDPLYSFAQTSLRLVSKGKYAKEVIHYALDYSRISKDGQRFIEQVLLITDRSIMFIQELKKLHTRVQLHRVRGLMIYFYDKKQNSINLELDSGTIVKIYTEDPEKNARFISECKKYLKQLSKQEAQKERTKAHLNVNKRLIPQTPDNESASGQQSFEQWEESMQSDMEPEEEKSQDGVPASLLDEHDSDYTVESYYEYDDEVEQI